MKLRTIALLCCLPVVLGGASAQIAASPAMPGAEGLVPHRAVYEMSLIPSKSGRDKLEAATGKLVYEFVGNVCEGFNTNTRFITEFKTQDGGNQFNDMRATMHESADGEQLRFVTRNFSNQKLRDEADGIASHGAQGLKVNLNKPAKTETTAGAKTLFPTSHMLQALQAAKAGEVIFQADLFDGSDGGQKVYATTAVLKKPIIGQIPSNNPAAKEPFLKQARYPMSISFFDKANEQSGELTPLYDLVVEMFENGVTYSMKLDYGEFALDGKLTALELLPKSACAN